MARATTGELVVILTKDKIVCVLGESNALDALRAAYVRCADIIIGVTSKNSTCLKIVLLKIVPV